LEFFIDIILPAAL